MDRVVVAVAVVAAWAAFPARAVELPVTARAAIVLDAANGDLMWEREPDLPLPPASTTKIVTAILAIESGRLDDELEVSAAAAETPPSKIHLQTGQHMALRNLLYALLLNSANDAAEVIAEGLGGSQEGFAARMNARARKLGALNSHFENPHGLTADGHVSTARDLARMFRYGLSLPLFREVLSTRTIDVPVDGESGYHLVTLHSHNRLISGYTYPVIGKTGYTLPARRCFVGAASNGEREIIIALLGASDLWGDARKLIEFGLEGKTEFEAPPVVEASVVPHLRLRRARVSQLLAHGRVGKRLAKQLLAREHRARLAERMASRQRQPVATKAKIITVRGRHTAPAVAASRSRRAEGDDDRTPPRGRLGKAAAAVAKAPTKTPTKTTGKKAAAVAATRTPRGGTTHAAVATKAKPAATAQRVKISGRRSSAVARR